MTDRTGYYADITSAPNQGPGQAAPPPGPQHHAPPHAPEPEPAPERGETKNDGLASAALVFAFLFWPLSILVGHISGVISALNAKSSTGNLAKLDGSYLVTSFAMPTSGDAGSAAAGTNPSASQAPAPAPAAKVLFDQSGTADWTSQPFHVTSGSTLKVTYSYWSNDGSNFIADLEGSDYSNMMSIANTIGTSGGKTTYAYPDADGQVHLSITATGGWHVKVTEVPAS